MSDARGDGRGWAQVRAVVVEELEREAKVDLSRLEAGASLRDDVPVDSLAMLQVFLRIEERLGVELDEACLSRAETLGDLVGCARAARAGA